MGAADRIKFAETEAAPVHYLLFGIYTDDACVYEMEIFFFI